MYWEKTPFLWGLGSRKFFFFFSFLKSSHFIEAVKLATQIRHLGELKTLKIGRFCYWGEGNTFTRACDIGLFFMFILMTIPGLDHPSCGKTSCAKKRLLTWGVAVLGKRQSGMQVPAPKVVGNQSFATDFRIFKCCSRSPQIHSTGGFAGAQKSSFFSSSNHLWKIVIILIPNWKSVSLIEYWMRQCLQHQWCNLSPGLFLWNSAFHWESELGF